jgi:CheY-like chemotaxis protein
MAVANILVVDDEDDIRRLVTLALEAQGFTVHGAANGMEAFEYLESSTPDLVILDVMMPVINGLEVLQHIRQKGMIPVILASSSAPTITCPSRSRWSSSRRESTPCCAALGAATSPTP